MKLVLLLSQILAELARKPDTYTGMHFHRQFYTVFNSHFNNNNNNNINQIYTAPYSCNFRGTGDSETKLAKCPLIFLLHLFLNHSFCQESIEYIQYN